MRELEHPFAAIESGAAACAQNRASADSACRRDHALRIRGGARSEIVLFDERDGHSARGDFPRNGHALNAAAGDQHVVLLSAHLLELANHAGAFLRRDAARHEKRALRCRSEGDRAH
jgi:hypothetical protein